MIIRQDQLSLLFILISLRGGMRNYSENYASKKIWEGIIISLRRQKNSQKSSLMQKHFKLNTISILTGKKRIPIRGYLFIIRYVNYLHCLILPRGSSILINGLQGS